MIVTEEIHVNSNSDPISINQENNIEHVYEQIASSPIKDNNSYDAVMDENSKLKGINNR